MQKESPLQKYLHKSEERREQVKTKINILPVLSAITTAKFMLSRNYKCMLEIRR